MLRQAQYIALKNGPAIENAGFSAAWYLYVLLIQDGLFGLS